MLSAALTGFGLGGGLIVAIGAQNAFVLRQGLARRHVFVVCLICALSDAALIALGVAGLGAVIAGSAALLRLVTWGGALFLFGYGALAFRRALEPGRLVAAARTEQSVAAAIAACLAFTFLNPHVYLDTVLLVGSLSAQFEGAERLAYAAGAVMASVLWFFGLGYGARLAAPLFARPAAWRALDLAIGTVMWAIAARLVI
ncbi:LysE/ArgO family amino acid transporter [Faunimonas sp. B44]|uniref:LysE/ArgO family amino acid transporter n=1 Tax=Faunimonas sp. B44 TaxID=3461493 RepID=UPI0040439EEA